VPTILGKPPHGIGAKDGVRRIQPEQILDIDIQANTGADSKTTVNGG
jgi:hypothetical protein